MVKFLSYFVFVLVVLFGCGETEKKEKIEFVLKTIDGQKIDISNYRGKKVILNFWATRCQPCIKEIPEFVEFYKKNKKNVILIGIAIYSREKDVRKIIEDFKINYPVCMSDGVIEGKLGINLVPTTIVLDENGYIIFRKVGGLTKNELESFLKK